MIRKQCIIKSLGGSIMKSTKLRIAIAFAALLAMSALGIGTVQAQTCSVPTAGVYDTIQAAINDPVCTTINVAAGTYDEGTITVNKNLTLEGAGPTSTIITITPGVLPVFSVTANNVTIRNLGITHATEIREGIRVSATSDLTIDNVYFTNLAIAPANNAYGINFLNSFTNLTVRNSRFIGNNAYAYERVLGIYVPAPYTANNFVVEDSLFENVFTGVDIRANVNGLTVHGNTFGPMSLPDCKAAASGIYLGDGPTSFNIDHVVIDGNTFTSYCRGVYVWDYADGGNIGSFDITNNIFTNSIYSSGVRLLAGGTGSPSVRTH
jgi:hypothetical protein